MSQPALDYTPALLATRLASPAAVRPVLLIAKVIQAGNRDRDEPLPTVSALCCPRIPAPGHHERSSSQHPE